MARSQVLVVGLDGYEATLGDQLMAEGLLPNLAALRRRSASFLLDHGSAKRTGLAWEHVSSGLAPDDGHRWAAVHFDAKTYAARQRLTSFRPFVADLTTRTVVFDFPYFDLAQAANTRGAVSWGAHDPGVRAISRPADLYDEIYARFGRYPATDYIYGFVWPSAAKAKKMADALIHATRLRAEIALWLFKERLPDWEFGVVVVSELHSASEALWHGIDPAHPLHDLPSAPAAAEGVRGVYAATEKMIGDLAAAFPDATIVAFNLHGMGANDSDVGSMLLLPELMYRHSFGRTNLREEHWRVNDRGIPMLDDNQVWDNDFGALLRTKPPLVRRAVNRAHRLLRGKHAQPNHPNELTVAWMPAAQYGPFWRAMRAFALPSFYDGRIRINLKGREAAGKVSPGDYNEFCAELETVLRECRDVVTGRPAIRGIERYSGPDPLRLDATDADLIVLWNGPVLGLAHLKLGTIGPYPYRRTGGHTGPAGVAYFAGPGISPGDYGTASAFDVVPTVIELLGERRPQRLTGRPLLTNRELAA
jgi:predicted AlkP superfamily phosphohydrolase/phosphomutase